MSKHMSDLRQRLYKLVNEKELIDGALFSLYLPGAQHGKTGSVATWRAHVRLASGSLSPITPS